MLHTSLRAPIALIAVVLAACTKDKPTPPSPSASGGVAHVRSSKPCDHPLPLTLGVSMDGTLVSETRCFAFDAIANVTLTLDVELKDAKPVELSVVDPERENADPVCRAELDKSTAPWGSPHSVECTFAKTAPFELRVHGTGPYRFTLRKR